MLGEFLWIVARKTFVEVLGVLLFFAVIHLVNHLIIKGKAAEAIFMISDELYFAHLVHQQVGFVLIKLLINRGVNCNLSIILLAFVFVAVLATVHYFVNKTVDRRLAHRVGRS